MAGEGLKQSKDVLPDGKRFTPQPKSFNEPDFNKAMNPRNNPKMEDRPAPAKRGEPEYPSYGDKGNPVVGPN